MTIEEQFMAKPTASKDQSRSTTRRNDMTPAEQCQLERVTYWKMSIFCVEEATKSFSTPSRSRSSARIRIWL